MLVFLSSTVIWDLCVLTAVQAQKCGHSGGGWNTGGWWDVRQWIPGITGQQYGPNHGEKVKTIVNHSLY